jgi:hypothetical protein
MTTRRNDTMRVRPPIAAVLLAIAGERSSTSRRTTARHGRRRRPPIRPAATTASSPTSRTWAWSNDGGSTWDGGGGTIPGSAAAAYEVDPSNGRQTDVFPTIAAGDPGKVDVGWLRTNRNLLDFNSETVDPTTGLAHIAYADDNTVNKLRVANQSGGPGILGH